MGREIKFKRGLRYYDSPIDGYCHFGVLTADRKYLYDICDEEIYNVDDNGMVEVEEDKTSIYLMSNLGYTYNREFTSKDLGFKAHILQKQVSDFSDKFNGFRNNYGVTIKTLRDMNDAVIYLQKTYDKKFVEDRIAKNDDMLDGMDR